MSEPLRWDLVDMAGETMRCWLLRKIARLMGLDVQMRAEGPSCDIRCIVLAVDAQAAVDMMHMLTTAIVFDANADYHETIQ